MILVFDTETTGLPDFKAPADAPHQPRVVQLAAILFTPDEEPIVTLNVLIRPDGWTIPEDAARVHGITTEAALANGIPIARALELFAVFTAPDTTLVGHNITFDAKLLRGEYRRIGRDMSFPGICTMRSATKFVGAKQANGSGKFPNLQETHQALFAEGFDGAHDALADVKATARIFFALRRRGLLPEPKASAPILPPPLMPPPLPVAGHPF